MSGSSGLSVRAHSSIRTPLTPHPDEGNILLRLLEDSANDLLQLLEENIPLTPALHTLREHMIMQDYSSQGEVTQAAHPWALTESSAYEILSALCYAHLPVLFYAQPSTLPGQSTNCALSSVTDLHRLPTPAPSLTPNSLRSSSCSVTSETSVSVDLATTRETPSMLPALGRRSRSHGEVTHGPSPPAKKRCRLAAFAGADQTGMFAPGDPPDPGFGPDGPHFINDECNRGARRLRVRVARAAALGYDPLEEGEEEEQEQGQEEQEQGWEEQEEDAQSDAGDQPLGGSADARRGAWRQRPLDDPKISCSDQAAAIIAELASAHCLSSIHNPLRWLRDIGAHLLDPSMVDDDSLLSIISRCKRMMEKDIRTNFMVMINFMTLVCKSQRCVFFWTFHSTPVEWHLLKHTSEDRP
jgi:hypothetical protein